MNFILYIGGKNKIRFCFLGSGSRFGFVRIFSDPHHWSGLWPHTVQHRNVSMYSWRIMPREIDLHQSAGSLHTVHSPNNILPSRRIEVLVVFRTWRTIESCVQFLSLTICCRRSDDGYLYCPVRTSSSKSRGKKLTWLIKFVLKKY